MDYNRDFFDRIINRRGTQCEKWDDYAVCDSNSLPFWVADMDFTCAQPITDALMQRAKHPCYGYTYISSDDSEALCRFWNRRHSLEIAPDETAMLPCVVTGLRACIRLLTDPGDGVIVQTPVYSPFYAAIKENGRRVLEAPLHRDNYNRYDMDLSLIETHLKNGARLMLLCNPHNPVSRLWSRDELNALSVLLNRYDAWLVSDEIHADFVYNPGVFVPMLSIEESRNRSVSLVSASKTFNIAGLQQANAVCMNKAFVNRLSGELRRTGVVFGNLFALEATRAAYNQGDQWLDGLLAYLDESRKIVVRELGQLLPEAKITPVEATYLAWIDLSAYDCSTDVLMSKTKSNGVILTAGTSFGKNTGDGFLRFNFACPHTMLHEGIQKLTKALKS